MLPPLPAVGCRRRSRLSDAAAAPGCRASYWAAAHGV